MMPLRGVVMGGAPVGRGGGNLLDPRGRSRGAGGAGLWGSGAAVTLRALGLAPLRMPPPPPEKSPGRATGRRDPVARLVDLRLALKRWRMRLKARLPFVRRSIHRRLEARLDRLVEAFHSAPPADACRVHPAKPPEGALGPELCLFVTHAPARRLKRHVVRHVDALRAAGAKVVLVVNTPLA